MGNSQAVRLPKEFRFDVDEPEITREGGLKAALKRGFSDDFTANGREQPPLEDNTALNSLFR